MYPAIEPYHSALLRVSNRHVIYYEQSGNPKGVPVLVVHGGPGAGSHALQRRFFDPARYRIILVDQRGCGHSQPFADYQDNTTQDLVADFEAIRVALGIDQWLLFGGSWGSLLSLVYAIEHPGRVLGLVLRGLFLGQAHEWQWLITPQGPARLFPDHWARFIDVVGDDLTHRGIEVLYQALGTARHEAVVRAFAQWEISIARLQIDVQEAEHLAQEAFAYSMGTLAIVYAKHHCFLPANYVLEHASVLQALPMVLVQGRFDVVTPMQSAWQLSQALPNARLYIEHAGHSASEEAIARRLTSVMDAWTLQ